jgi:S-adenosylmethionine:tRNA ribosyltransferase-isomerase
MDQDKLLSSYGYELPNDLIAQIHAIPRDSSRLLVVNSPKSFTHSIFNQLPQWLLPGDLLVLNNTRVIPARLYGQKLKKSLPTVLSTKDIKVTGASVEILLLEEKGNNCWLALVKPGKRFKLGTEIVFIPLSASNKSDSLLTAKVIARDESTGGRILQFQIPPKQSFWQLLEEYGEVPLPPYIIKSNQDIPYHNEILCTTEESELEQYQTVFAQQPGAIAAPTAGLHFTEQLLEQLGAKGIKQTYITLHVGIGTFRPVKTENITQHQMHQEWVEVTAETVEQIQKTKAQGGRIIAVGTTAVRALEGTAYASGVLEGKPLQAFSGKTNLFIYPGYRWQIVDGLITNFHLPHSSLLMLVSALIGRERLLSLYQEAIAEKYRFYSFGDAMLILPEAQLLIS